MLGGGGFTKFRTRTISFGSGQRLGVLGKWERAMLLFLTKSMRLMRHSCGSSCIWKNIWRMLEMLMQARTALEQRKGTNHPILWDIATLQVPPHTASAPYLRQIVEEGA